MSNHRPAPTCVDPFPTAVGTHVPPTCQSSLTSYTNMCPHTYAEALTATHRCTHMPRTTQLAAHIHSHVHLYTYSCLHLYIHLLLYKCTQMYRHLYIARHSQIFTPTLFHTNTLTFVFILILYIHFPPTHFYTHISYHLQTCTHI